MVDIKRDHKTTGMWIITRTDSEGFHKQLELTESEMDELVRLWTTTA